ncbi:amidohydrolase [Dethiothermospora halolimnae]|uniref:amidohydrolase n=1 Tax=Dethiothermospora halolimnae TaxID=3114390 RepID=UPI003CCB9102
MNILIKNAMVLPMGKEKKILENISIGIEGDIIKYIGDIPKDFKADKVIDGNNRMVMPGLINSHTHIAMSLFRNYADDLPFWPWLTEKIWPLEDKLTSEDVYWGSMLSIAEMIRSGITSFADMYFFMDETAKAVKESGIRASLSRGVAGEGKDDFFKLEEMKEFYNKWHGECDGRITVMAGPHAPYTCSPDYLKEIIKMVKGTEMKIHIHLSESKKEVEDSYKAYGKSPIEHVKDIGLLDLHTLAAHCVHLSDNDIDILAEKNVNVVNNPGSNLKLGNGFARIDEMLKKGINIALGTDGSSSNNNLNMFEEMNLAALINKGLNQNSTSVPAITAIKMATENGALALGIEKETGTIEIGKKADMILIDIDKPHLYPHYNLISSMAYSAQGSDVDTVIVNGEVVMENRELKTIDEEKVMYNTEKKAKELISKA